MNKNCTIITYNNLNGGVDTFLTTLIDGFYSTLYCNEDHPGLPQYNYIIKILRYKTFLSIFKKRLGQNLGKKLYNLLMIFSFGIGSFIESIYVYRQLKDLEKNVLIVSGGFPSTHILQYLACKLSIGHNIVYNIHNYTYYNNIRNIFDMWFLLKTKTLKIKIITVSLSCSINLANNRYLSNIKKISYIYNPLKINNEGAYFIRIFKQVDKNKIKICIVANFEPRKGHENLVKIIEYLEDYKLKKFEFNLYGKCEGKYYHFLRQLLTKKYINSIVYFHDFICNKELIYKSNDISLILSQDYESFGYCAAESLAFGIPIVSTDTGALPEIIGENGLIFYKRDFKKASLLILNLVENPDLYQRKAIEGVKYANERFGHKYIRKRYKHEFSI
jgi:glycosyltransferase involved in cell wall biosynthesis